MASRTSLLLFYLSVFLAATFTSAQEGCPDIWEALNGRCYFFSELIGLPRDWQYAREYCFLFNEGPYVYDLLVLDSDIEEPTIIAGHMQANSYTAALIGLHDLGLAQSLWAWVDGNSSSLQSSLWACDYPNPLNNNHNHVAQLVFIEENIDNGLTANRYRMKDVSLTTVDNFICEGPLMPTELLEKQNAKFNNIV